MIWGEAVNNLVEKVNGANGHLIFAPILELDEGKSAVFGMLDFKHDDRLSTVVCELRGGGGGVAHAQSVDLKGFLRKNFLLVFAIIFIFILLDMMRQKASNRFFFAYVTR